MCTNRLVGAVLATTLAVLAAGACERAAVAPAGRQAPAVRAALTPLADGQAMGKFQVCSDGSAATYAFSAENYPDVTTGQKTGSVTVAAGECAVLYTTDVHGLATVNAVTVTMTNPTTPNVSLGSVVGHALYWHCDLTVSPVTCTTDDTPTTYPGPTITYNVNGDVGALAYFHFTPPPVLTLEKTADAASVVAGNPIGFTMTVTNLGPGVAAGVMLADPLPVGAGLAWSVSPANAACTIAGGTLTCSFGDLAVNASATVHVTSPTTAQSCASYSNTGTAQASNAAAVQATAAMAVTCPGPTPCPAGSFSYQFNANGDLEIVYDQFPAPNDNSYGANAVGWPNGHRFSDLYNSDHAGFQLVDPAGVVRLSFNVDYLTASAGAPSGYKSLGVSGGDGKMIVGTPDGILATTSLDRNLNNVNIPGLFNAHAQQFGSVNLFMDSPPTDPAHQTYIISDPSLAGWDFRDTYYVTITAAKLASLGFNSSTWKVEPNLSQLHNSPAKPCPPSGATLSITKYEVKDKQVKITILNSGSADVFLTALTLQWPSAVNGKLMQVKLDGDVVYDNPDIAGGTANLTTAQLVADQNKRKINHNSSDVYTLVFEKNADPNLSHYAGTVTIGGIVLTVLPH